MRVPGSNNVLGHLRRVFQRQEYADAADADLLNRYIGQGDEAAFEALVQRHGPMVLGVCRRILPNAHDAEDAFQATFLVLVGKAASLRLHSTLANWLYGVACRTAQHARHAAIKRQAKEAAMPARTETPEDTWADLLPILDQELERLSQKQRAVVVLCALQSKTRKEAARLLGCADGTVASRLSRGLALLAQRLARHGPTVASGTLAVMLAERATAAVPTPMASSTIKAAGLFAAGRAAAPGALSGNVASLTEGVLKTMMLTKLRTTMAGLLLVSALVSGAGVMYGTQVTEQRPVRGPAEKDDKEREKLATTKPAEDAAAGELRALQGEWKVVGLEEDGRKATEADMKGMSWTFKGTKILCVNPGKKPIEIGEVKLDPSKDPMHFDLVSLEGPTRGETILGIYKREKGRLTICLRDVKASEKGRPTEFSTEAGSGLGMITLESLRDPPKPADRPKPPAEKPAADLMQGKRWIVKGSDTLQLVGPDGDIGSPVNPPRFRLEPGQELVYAGEMQTMGSGGREIRVRGERRLWVLRASKEGGWRVVMCSVTGDPGNSVQKTVSFAWYDLYPDGRLVECESSGVPMEARYLLPRLPRDAAEAAPGWATKGEQVGQTYRYRLLPSARSGRCILEAIPQGILYTASGVAIKLVFTWDSERCLPESIQMEAAHPDKRMERANLKLGEVIIHDSTWCRGFAADAERFFAAQSAYHRMLARQGRTPAEVKADLVKAESDLKAARNRLKRPEFRARMDAMLAEHELLARAVTEEAEKRTAIMGKPAPDWSTTDLGDRPRALKDFRGKVVILDFWHRSCFWCLRAMPQVKEIAAHFKDQPVVVLGMNTDANLEDAQFVVKKMGLRYANLKAARLPEKYKVEAFPTLIVIDQEGVIRDVHVGYSATLKEEVMKAVEGLLKGKR